LVGIDLKETRSGDSFVLDFFLAVKFSGGVKTHQDKGPQHGQKKNAGNMKGGSGRNESWGLRHRGPLGDFSGEKEFSLLPT